MFSDYSDRPLNASAYSDQPFTFLDQAAQNDLANITAISLIENGERAARENWQQRRLTHLLRHAQSRSAFWRGRLPSRTPSHGMLKFVPIQSRKDIASQSIGEGSLMAGDGRAPVASYASTGSTGAPVKVFVTPENGYYNAIRSLAQYFIYGLPLDQPRTKILPAFSLDKLQNKALAVESADSWAGPLSRVFRNGASRNIVHQFDDAALVRELLRAPVGYLVCASRYVEVLMANGGPDLLARLGISVWLHSADFRDPQLVATLAGIGIRSLSNYSAGEIGPIACECASQQGYFHVVHSNVVVESDESLTVTQNGLTLGRLLVTHLHSYATPIIRYDIGDFGRLHQQCPCGHDGPTISDIYGRGKHFLRHPDGRHLPFYLSTRTLLEILPFKEIRFRQQTVDTIDIDVGGREAVTDAEAQALTAYVIKATDPAFKVRINPQAEIDWSSNPKRLFFTSAVA